MQVLMFITCAKDRGILEVYKPQGLPTTSGEISPSLAELVLQAAPEQKQVQGFHPNEGGLLYRLDNDTSGLVLFATTQETFHQFTEDTEKQLVKKHYLAYVEGIPRQSSGLIRFPIAHHPRSKRKMIAQKELNQKKRSEWRTAETYYRVLSTEPNGNSWLHVMIFQGARHQIRVHCAAIGHPLVGDILYNSQSNHERSMLLRCQTVEWVTKHQTFSLTDLRLPAEEKVSFPQLDSLTIT